MAQTGTVDLYNAMEALLDRFNSPKLNIIIGEEIAGRLMSGTRRNQQPEYTDRAG